MTQFRQTQKTVQLARKQGISPCRLPGPIRAREEIKRNNPLQCAGRYARYSKKVQN